MPGNRESGEQCGPCGRNQGARRRTKAVRRHVADAIEDEGSLHNLKTGNTAIQQSLLLKNDRVCLTHRQQAAAQIGRVQGNRHLQRLLSPAEFTRSSGPSHSEDNEEYASAEEQFVSAALGRHLSSITDRVIEPARQIMPAEEVGTESEEIVRGVLPGYLQERLADRNGAPQDYGQAIQAFGRKVDNAALDRYVTQLSPPEPGVKVTRTAPLQQVRRFSRSSGTSGTGGTVHPTGIARTTAGRRLNFGAVYTHTFNSSTGRVADLDGVLVGERVTVARDDFGLGWGGVPLGTITARVNSSGQMNDQIGTPARLINRAMPRVRSLPAVLNTPQTLHWQDASGSWNQFTAVNITFTVRDRGGTLEAVTVDNGVQVVEPYTGPAPGGGP
jgi:hypothetical protein